MATARPGLFDFKNHPKDAASGIRDEWIGTDVEYIYLESKNDIAC